MPTAHITSSTAHTPIRTISDPLINPVAPQESPVLTGIDTTSLSVIGTVAYLDVLGFAMPTDNLSARASTAVGIYFGTPTQLTTSGVTTCRFTSQGGAPIPGALVYLAAATDDSGTGAGKLTASPPQSGPVYTDYTGFAGTPPQNVVAVGRCIDPSLYASAKTATVELTLPPLVRSVDVDQTFHGYQYSGFSAGNNFTAAGTSTGTTFHDKETVIVLFSIDSAYSGSGGIISNANGGLSRGWSIGASTDIVVVNWSTGVLVRPGQPKAGVNCVVATIHDGVLWTSMNGGAAVQSSAAVSSILDPDGTCTFSIGTGFGQPWTNGAVLAAAGLAREATGAELTRWSGMVYPTPPANRFVLPQDVITDAALKWFWAGAFGTSVYGLGFGTQPFTLTKNGTPSQSIRVERVYRNLAPLILDSEPPMLDTHGVVRGSAMSRIALATSADQPDVCVAVYCDDAADWDNDNPSVLVDGTTLLAIPNITVTVPSTAGLLPDGAVRYFWVTLNTNAAPSATHHVEVISGSQIRIAGSFGTAGGYIAAIVAASAPVFDTPSCNKRLVILGDDVQLGQDSILPHTINTPLTLIRGDFPTSGGPGRVTADCAVAQSLFNLYTAGGNSALPLARRIVQDGLEGGAATVLVYLAIGFRDYLNGQWTATAYAAQYQALVNEIARRQPTWTIYVQRLIQANYDAVQNGLGDTVSAYNAVIAALTGCTKIDARVPNALAWQGASPQGTLSIAGITAYKANVKAALNY